MIDLAPLARHPRVALSFSGGKDSLACVYLLREQLSWITVYHLDTGDLLPEMREIVAHVKTLAPNFVHIQGDVTSWIKEFGLPTDLLPHSAHPIGQEMREGPKLVARYDCCYANLMLPIYEQIRAHGNSLLIRGTKAVDMKRLPLRSGETTGDGIELWYPLQNWSNDQVFDYLRAQGAPIARVYEHVVNSPECARCSAWWGEGRSAYLERYHPALWVQYQERLATVAEAILGPINHLKRELSAQTTASEEVS